MEPLALFYFIILESKVNALLFASLLGERGFTHEKKFLKQLGVMAYVSKPVTKLAICAPRGLDCSCLCLSISLFNAEPTLI